MRLLRVALTPSGRPQLQAGEVEKALLDKVDLEFDGTGGVQGGPAADRYQGGYCILTNQRLIWIDATATTSGGGSRSCCLPLFGVHNCTKRTSGALGFNSKIRLELKVSVDAQEQPCVDMPGARFQLVMLRCRGEAPDSFREQLWASVLAAQQQQQQQRTQQQQQGQQQQQQQQLEQQRPSSSGGMQQRPASYHGSSGSWGMGSVGAGISAAQPHADAAMLAGLVDMGFPRNQAMRALLATNNEGAQQAIDWILAFGSDPHTLDPLEEPAQQQMQQAGGSGMQGQQVFVHTQHAYAPGRSASPLGASNSSMHNSYEQAQGGGSSYAGPLTSGLQQRQQQRPASPYSAPAALPGQQLLSSYPAVGASASTSGGFSNPLLAPAGQQQQQQQQQQGFGGSFSVGVAGIMQRESSKTSETSRSLEQAFSDLSALMAMAQHMVALAERFRGAMAGEGAGGADGGGEEALDWETQMQLVSAGITSPVTKESAGARYHTELSRQLADFLTAPLARAGGLLQLPDVYCLFNRARGTELVSPDDLLKAIGLFPQIGVPLRLRRFPSGVSVIQAAQHSDEAVIARIAQLLADSAAKHKAQAQASTTQPTAGAADSTLQACPVQMQLTPKQHAEQELGPPLSAGDVARALGVPLAIAHEQLLVAEAAGVLCRDDGPNGLQFFRNFFKDAALCAC